MDIGSINLQSMQENPVIHTNRSIPGLTISSEHMGDIDSFEKSVDVMEIVCESYPNFQVRTCMPISIFGDRFGYDMQKDIAKCMTDLYAGRIDKSEMEDYFKECCNEMRKYRTGQRQTTGVDTDDNRQIVSQIYEMFAKENQRAARNANYDEGLSYNEKYGGRTDDWVYYNSDYHYELESTKSVIRNITKSMADEWELPEINMQEIEDNSKYTLDGGFDFNSGWNYSYRNQVGRGSMENEKIIPPQNFSFFYKEHYAFPEGVLDIDLNGKEYSRKVPFSVSREGGLEGQIFDLDKLTDNLILDKKDNKDYRSLLKNFTIFTRWYSCKSKINDFFGSY